MYDYSQSDLEERGWDRFVVDVWESIFLSYRRFTAVRTLGRRWSDLLQGGIGCSQELADELVRIEIVQMDARIAIARKDAAVVLAAMDEALADMGADLADIDGIQPDERARLLAEHARLRSFLRDSAAGSADG